MTKVLGIIGGSGIYEISDIEHGQWINIESPFGFPSDELFIGEVDGLKIVFLPIFFLALATCFIAWW